MIGGVPVVIDDATARDIIIRIVSKHWPEKADHAYPGEQFFGGAWRYPGWGCDTLDHMVDDLVSVVAGLVAGNSKQSDVL